MYTGVYQIQQLEQKSLYHSRFFSTPAAPHPWFQWLVKYCMNV